MTHHRTGGEIHREVPCFVQSDPGYQTYRQDLRDWHRLLDPREAFPIGLWPQGGTGDVGYKGELPSSCQEPSFHQVTESEGRLVGWKADISYRRILHVHHGASDLTRCTAVAQDERGSKL